MIQTEKPTVYLNKIRENRNTYESHEQTTTTPSLLRIGANNCI